MSWGNGIVSTADSLSTAEMLQVPIDAAPLKLQYYQ
jgi:hypothetical protein